MSELHRLPRPQPVCQPMNHVILNCHTRPERSNRKFSVTKILLSDGDHSIKRVTRTVQGMQRHSTSLGKPTQYQFTPLLQHRPLP